MITPKLKESLLCKPKLEMMKAAIALIENSCIILLKFGVSPETMSFISEGLSKIAKEFKEGYEVLQFEDLTKEFKK